MMLLMLRHYDTLIALSHIYGHCHCRRVVVPRIDAAQAIYTVYARAAISR